MKTSLPTVLFLALLLMLACHGARAEADTARHVQITVLPGQETIAAGGTLPVAIAMTIDSGWHTYWRNPGDAGQAPEVNWTLPAGFRAAKLRFPAPQKMPEGPLATYGYEDAVTMLQNITAPARLPPGPLTLAAHIAVLVCKDICIPEQGDYAVTLNNGAPADNSAAVAAAARDVIDEDAGRKGQLREADGMAVITIPMPPSYKSDPELLPADWGIIDNAQTARAALSGTDLELRQKRAERPLADVTAFHVLLAYRDPAGLRRVQAYVLTPDKEAAAPPAPAGPGFLPALLLALLGGLILNLMPCVFPVLSLKALKLVALPGRERRHARLLGLSYAAGILAAFTALAVALVALRAGGAKIGWGFQLQNPLFVLPLAWLLFLLGLNLSGAIEIGGRFAGAGQKLAAAGGHAGSFFTGLLAAVVATPCTAPFMGVAIGYALTRGPAEILAVFLALGCGLALPFLLLSFVPALQRALPKPGAWMVTFRQLLAFPLYLSAAWLAWVLALQAGDTALLAALAGAVLLAFAAWLLAKRQRVLAALILLSVAALAPLARHIEKHAGDATAGSDWRPFSDLPDLLRGIDPVFVDLTAAWCITCKINEAAVLHTSATMALFNARHVHTLAGDWTNRDAAISDFLRANGRAGVPLYMFYGARDAGGARPAPVVLPQILTSGIVETVLKETR